MSSSDASFDSSSDFNTAETEVEYDLEVEVMSNASEQKDTSDYDEPKDLYANEPLADYNWLAQWGRKKEKNKNSKRNYALDMPFSLFGLLLHLGFPFFLRKQRLSQTRKRSMAWNDAIPRLL